MYFDNVNLLRAFAALSVLVYHVIELAHWETFPVYGPLVWFRIGWLGVDLFFVISGFVIALTASLLYEQHGSEFYKIFFRRRLARIVPLYLLTGFIFVLFCQPTLLEHPKFLAKNIVYHVLFIHNIDPGTHGAIDGPNWSIGVEMQFYLLIMLTVRFWIRMAPWKILLICVLISWIWRTLAYLLGCCDAVYESFLSMQLFGCLDGFGFGICLCRMVLDQRRQSPAPKAMRRNPWFWMALLVLASTVTFSIFWNWGDYWDFWWMVIFWKTLAALTFFTVLVLVIQLASLVKMNRWIFGPVWYLGEISYGIYLWHRLVIESLGQVKGITQFEFLLLTLFFTIALSIFSWHFVEKPLIERFR